MAFKQALQATVAALALTSAVVPPTLAAEQVAIAPSTAHPLLSGSAYGLSLTNISTAVREVSKDNLAGTRAGTFHAKLEEALKQTRDKPRTVIAPDGAMVEQLSIVGIVPPTGMDNMPVGICVQKGVPNASGELQHTVLGTFQLMADGKVVPQVWTGPKVGGTDPATGKFNAACAPFRAAYIELINKEAAQMAQKPPTKPASSAN